MPVYAIRAGDTGPVKLGKADDPAERMAALQVGHYETLKLLRIWEGSFAEEAALHLRFADLHIRGEWYGYSRAMLGDVGLREVAPVAVIQVGPDLLTTASILMALGGYRAVAEALKLSPVRVHNWTRRGIARQYWPDVVAMAERGDKAQITFDALKASMVPAEPKRAA